MRIAVFDLTDCEGCEVLLLSLQDELMEFSNEHELVNFRFISDYAEQGPFDIVFIEGMVGKNEDIEKIKYLRSVSKLVITLGACATTGGINAIISSPQDREQAKKTIYNEDYKLRTPTVSPVSAYIPVDFAVRGCPPDKNQLKRFLHILLQGKIPHYDQQSVCLGCPKGPFKGEKCLVSQSKKCLGTFTWGGCNGICVEQGLYCWGCWGFRDGITAEIVQKTLPFLDPKDVEKIVNSFNALSNQTQNGPK